MDRESFQPRSRGFNADPDDDQDLTESQKEWAEWVAHGYRKLSQPRSIRRFGLLFSLGMATLLLTVFWVAARGGFPW